LIQPNIDPQRKPTILIVDDEEIVRLLFQSLLNEEGYPNVQAETGQQGIQLIGQYNPALVLVDKNLPDMSGLEFISNQKKNFPDSEFIMITGYASLDSAVKAMEMGAFSYLTKPFSDMDMVMDRIRAALEVNTLRVETSLLRSRLNKLSDGIENLNPQSTTAGPKPQIIEQLYRTVSFLESFLDKREKPPSASIWARTVDMIEEEIRRLKRLLHTANQA
jgi:DNA-binding NtrC family response regulator